MQASQPRATIVAGKLTYVVGFVSLLCLTIIGFLVYDQSASEKMISRNVPSIDALMMAKFELAQSHLWLEEELAGGDEDYKSLIDKHGKEALWYARVLLEGGENHKGTFVPVVDENFRTQVNGIQADLNLLLDLTHTRLANRMASMPGSEIDEEFDQLYHQIIEKIDVAEIRLKEIIYQDQHQFANTQALITLLVSFLMLTLIAGIYLYQRQNVADKQKSNRQYTAQLMLTKCTAAALEARNEKEFLFEIAEWVVGIGDFGLAWIGLTQDDGSKTVEPAAWSELNADYLEGITVSYADIPEGNGPIGRAIRSGETVVANNINKSKGFAPWRDDALKRGLNSGIAIPLKLGGRVIGVFTCYGRTVGAFDDHEIQILQALANNIVLGLQMLRSRGQQQQVNENLKQNVKERTHDLRKLSMAVEQSGDMTFITDANGRIEYVNRQFTKLTGYELSEVAGQTSSVLRHPDTAKELHEQLWETVSSGKVWRGQYQDRRKDGTSFWSEVTVSPIFDSSGSISNFVSSHQDITDRKNTEQKMHDALRQTDIANKAKSELLANMSHELRTPLNAVIGFSEAFIFHLYGPLGHEKYDEYAKDIYYSGTHLLELINDILDVSAIEAGRLDLNESTCDLKNIMQSAVRLVEVRALESSITVGLELAEDLPMVLIDERRMKQILLNLLSNAVKFTDPGGKVLLKAAKSDAGGVVCEITDTGIGMDSDDVVIALSEFGQVDGGLNRK
ncbi:MAG: PAS domain S-box protein, partial [Rhodospirillaceae bacterium]|nr:PAS domain S-box protein [Rhodospirillaceae bacterium]